MIVKPLITVSGPSASGKSHLAGRIGTAGIFQHTSVLPLDMYCRSRSDYDAPSSIDWNRFESDIDTLENGGSIPRVHFDHCESSDDPITWRGCLIIEGLFPLHNAKARARADLNIYISPNMYLSGARRLFRDIAVYRDSPRTALLRLEESVVPSIERYVQPQIEFANVVYTGDGDWPALRQTLMDFCSK